MTEFRGVYSPICTPFSADGERIDEKALRALIDFEIDNGIHGIIPCGGTGEFFALSVDERKRVTAISAEQVDGRTPVVPHTGACSTREVVELSKHAQGVGADALMIVPPFYDVPTEDEIVDHYRAISDAVSLPIMAYNIPAHSKINLRLELLARIVEAANVTMLKDSTGDLVQLQLIIDKLGDRLVVFNGADTLFYSAMILGAKGSVWGGANPTPKECVRLYELVEEKQDLVAGRELWSSLYPLNRFYENEGFVASVKAACAIVGLELGDPRPPFRPLAPLKKEELTALLDAVRRNVDTLS
jgi:4-hydroxy-tetrahydrodipicolinate synthase